MVVLQYIWIKMLKFERIIIYVNYIYEYFNSNFPLNQLEFYIKKSTFILFFVVVVWYQNNNTLIAFT